MHLLRQIFDPDLWSLLANFSLFVGLPFAIGVFAWERRKARLMQQEEIYQRLSDEYTDFIKLVLQNADLGLLRRGRTSPDEVAVPAPFEKLKLTAEQLERRYAMLNILVALFERAYIMVYKPGMDAKTTRLWRSWEDYMREWCRREEFRELLPTLLRGEDPAFVARIRALSVEEAPRTH